MPPFQQPPAFHEPKKTNVLGLVGLGLAILGTILSFVKYVMVLGWVLLPIAFILSVVALFMKNQGKVAAISAIVISIVGTMIALAVGVFYLALNIDEEITGGKTVVSGGTNEEPKGIFGGDKQGASRENPLPLGSTIENNEWAITVNSVDLNADAKIKAENQFNDPAKPGNVQILVNMTYTYKGNNPEGEYLLPIVDFVTASGNSISWSDTLIVAPDALQGTGNLYNGATATGNVPFEVPAADIEKGTLAVTPGILGEKRFFAVK